MLEASFQDCKVGGERRWRRSFSLTFCYDTLIFSEHDQLSHLGWVLMWFEALSGSKINLEKSEIISIGNVTEIYLVVRWVVFLPPTLGCFWG